MEVLIPFSIVPVMVLPLIFAAETASPWLADADAATANLETRQGRGGVSIDCELRNCSLRPVPSEYPKFERSALGCVRCRVAKPNGGVSHVVLRRLFTEPDLNLAIEAMSLGTAQDIPFDELGDGRYRLAKKFGEKAFTDQMACEDGFPRPTYSR